MNSAQQVTKAVKTEAISAIEKMNKCGMLVSLVWSSAYAGMQRGLDGMAISQQQYGMQAHRFYIIDGTLHYRGMKRKLLSAR